MGVESSTPYAGEEMRKRRTSYLADGVVVSSAFGRRRKPRSGMANTRNLREITTTESLKIILVSCIFTFPTEHILVVSAISSCIIDHITYNISDLVVTALELPRNT